MCRSRSVSAIAGNDPDWMLRQITITHGRTGAQTTFAPTSAQESLFSATLGDCAIERTLLPGEPVSTPPPQPPSPRPGPTPDRPHAGTRDVATQCSLQPSLDPERPPGPPSPLPLPSPAPQPPPVTPAPAPAPQPHVPNSSNSGKEDQADWRPRTGYSIVMTMGQGSGAPAPGAMYVDLKGHMCALHVPCICLPDLRVRHRLVALG